MQTVWKIRTPLIPECWLEWLRRLLFAGEASKINWIRCIQLTVAIDIISSTCSGG